jgi:hypothetical protein
MIEVENRDIAIWVLILLGAYLLFSVVSGVLLGAYTALSIAGFAAEAAETVGIDPASEVSEEQIEALTNEAIERLRHVNWWVSWPLINSIAWAATALFLGTMRLVKYNEGLVAVVYLQSLLATQTEWEPPDSFAIEAVTIVLALLIVHFVSRWASAMRESPLPAR